jgi:hypothetical protein
MGQYISGRKIKMTKHILVVLFTIISLYASAQQYPVQLVSQLNNPTPLNLSLFYSDVNPKVILTLTNRDLQGAPLKVRLKIIINGPGLQLITSNTAVLPPIILESGISTTLSAADIASYFSVTNLDFNGVVSKSEYQSAGQLPEGAYSYCFEVWDYYTDKLLSSPYCNYAYCTLAEPPLLNEPLNKSTVLFSDPANIQFNWTSRHSNNPDLMSAGFNYLVTLKELIDTVASPEVAFNYGRIIYTQSVASNNLQYNVALPAYVHLLSNRIYAWNVQVVPMDAALVPALKNRGISEIYSFKYKKDCTPPQYKSATPNGRLVEIVWEQNSKVRAYDLQYAESTSSIWHHKTIDDGSTQITLDDVEIGKVYKYNVGTVCDNSIEYGIDAHFVIPPQPLATKSGNVSWGVKAPKNYTPTGNLVDTVLNGNFLTAISNSYERETVAIDKHPLNNVKVGLYKGEELLNNIYTDEHGDYSLDIDTAAILNDKVSNYTLKIEVLGKVDNFKKSTVTYQLNNKNTGGAILSAIEDVTMMYVSNIVYEPKVYPASRQAIAKGTSGTKVYVYLPKTVWLDAYSNLNIDQQVKQITYEGNEYIKIGEIDDQHRYLTILGATTLHNVLTNIVIKNTNAFTKYVKPILGSYWYNSILETGFVQNSNEGKLYQAPLLFDPTVTFYGKVWRDPNKTETLPLGKVDFKDISYNTLGSTNADNNGNYALTVISSMIDPFAFLYTSRMDGSVKISSNSINFEFPDTSINNNMINYDMVLPPLSGKKHIYYGKFLDPNGVEIPVGAQLYFNNKLIATLTRSGNYILNIEDGYKLEDSLTIKIPSYKNQPFFEKMENLSITNWVDTYRTRLNISSTVAPITINSATEQIVAVTQADITLQYGNQIVIAPEMNNIPVNVKLKLKNVSTGIEKILTNSNVKKVFVLNVPAGAYDFQVLADSASPNFLPFSSSFTVGGEGQTIVLKLQPATTITGKITDKTSRQKIDSVSINIIGMEYRVLTDTFGNYILKIPSREAKIHIRKDKYSAIDSVLRLNQNSQYLTLNIALPRFVYKAITKLSGFEVIVDSQYSATYDSNYVVTGNLKLKSNGYFTNDNATQTLKFINKKVVVNENGYAFPIDDSVRFEEISVKAKAFGFAPVEILNPVLKQYTGLDRDKRRFSEGVISGNVVFKLSTIKTTAPNFPLNLNDANLNYSATSRGGTLINYVSPGVDTLSAFPLNKKFYVHLLDTNATVNTTYIVKELFNQFDISLQKDSCVLSPNGMSLAGYLKLPSFVFQSNNRPSGLKIYFKNTAIFNKQFVFKNWLSETISNSESVVQLNRLYAKLETVELKDIGTSNPILSFNGQAAFYKEDFNITLRPWKIKEFQVKSSTAGLIASLKVTPPVKKMYLNGLEFYPKDNTDVLFGFKREDSSFSLNIAGSVNFSSPMTGNNATFLSKVLPINIETFQYNSSNGSMLMAAVPNTKLDFSVVKVSLDKLVVNVGAQVTIGDIINLVDDTVAAHKNYNSIMNESPSSKWAVGLKGSLEFPNIKGMNASANASLAFGVFDDKFQFTVSEVGLGIENPSFSLNARLGLKLYGDTIGFKGAARLDLLDNTFAASLAYYKIKNKDIYLAAGFTAPLIPAPVTYPIQWYALGGGFSYSTKEPMYYVGVNGQFGLIGTTKEMGYVDSAYLGILFNFSGNCIGFPTIKGGGNLNLKGKKWGYVTSEIDYCNASLLANVHLEVPEILPNVKASVDGILYGVAPIPPPSKIVGSLLNAATGVAASVSQGVSNVSSSVTSGANGVAASVSQGASNVSSSVTSGANGVANTFVEGLDNGMLFLKVNASVNIGSAVKANFLLAVGVNYNNNKSTIPALVKSSFIGINDLVKDDVKGGTKNGFNGMLLEADVTLADQSGSYNLGPFGASYRLYASANTKFWYNYNSNSLGMRIALAGGAAGSISAEHVASLSGSADINAMLEGGYNGSKWYYKGRFNTSLQIYNSNDVSCNNIKLSWAESCTNVSYPCGPYWFGVHWCDGRICVPYINGVAFKGCLSLNVNTSWIEGEKPSFSVSN